MDAKIWQMDVKNVYEGYLERLYHIALKSIEREQKQRCNRTCLWSLFVFKVFIDTERMSEIKVFNDTLTATIPSASLLWLV